MHARWRTRANSLFNWKTYSIINSKIGMRLLGVFGEWRQPERISHSHSQYYTCFGLFRWSRSKHSRLSIMEQKTTFKTIGLPMFNWNCSFCFWLQFTSYTNTHRIRYQSDQWALKAWNTLAHAAFAILISSLHAFDCDVSAGRVRLALLTTQRLWPCYRNVLTR